MQLVGRFNILMSLVILLTILILYYRLKPTSKAVPSELPLDHTLLYIGIPFCGTPSILDWAMSHAKEPCGCKDGVCQCIDRNTPWLVSKHTTTCGHFESLNSRKPSAQTSGAIVMTSSGTNTAHAASSKLLTNSSPATTTQH